MSFPLQVCSPVDGGYPSKLHSFCDVLPFLEMEGPNMGELPVLSRLSSSFRLDERLSENSGYLNVLKPASLAQLG